MKQQILSVSAFEKPEDQWNRGLLDLPTDCMLRGSRIL